MSSQEIDTTEEEIILPQQTKTKPKRTDAQLAVLASAREKAIVVRRGNAELRKKEKELAKLEKEEELRERREKLDRLLAAKGKKPQAPPTYKAVQAEEEEELEEIIYKKKKKPRKQKIVYVSGSDSEEEEAKVVYKRKPKQPQATRFQEAEEAAPAPPSQIVYTQHGAVGTTRRFGT